MSDRGIDPTHPFIVWVDYGQEGWKPTSCKNAKDAFMQRDAMRSNGNSTVLITRAVRIEAKIDDEKFEIET